MTTKTYDKLTQREHVLLRPDTYIGTTDITNINTWIYKDNIITKQDIIYNPGLFKIYDEILINARDASINDKTCNIISIRYNQEENYISIFNNGNDGIPILKHEKYDCLIPTMIFGELLTSSSYDDSIQRTTGSRNGIGSKACNIFSKKFIVEIENHKDKKKFTQTWENNMLTVNEPIVVKLPASVKNSSVRITFYPDCEKFHMEDGLDDYHYSLFYKRALDIAGTTDSKVKLSFNDIKINITDFKSYIKMYDMSNTLYYDAGTENWNVGVMLNSDKNGECISFVNGINTYTDGTHCNHVADSIIKPILVELKKKDKNFKLTTQSIKDNFIFFINSTIINPSFSSQTKETLTTKVENFGSKYTPNPDFIAKIIKCGIVKQLLELSKLKEQNILKKTDGKKQTKISGIPKLEDANKAGTKEGYKCTLILTEGDSAKSTAMAGVSVVGRDYYGVFPLKGKLLNVRDATIKQMTDNEEIKSLKTIIGLKQTEVYDNIDKLRYGHIMILTDQDSVSGDTPLLLKDNKGDIVIKNIEDITYTFFNSTDDKYNMCSIKEYGICDYKVWTDVGWTNIKNVMRHKVSKQMYRVLTNSGCVDVTEDHSLLNESGDKITPIDCIKGTRLLHSFPLFDRIDLKYTLDQSDTLHNLSYRNESIPKLNNIVNISIDEAYVMGLFLAEGECKINEWMCTETNSIKKHYSWYISNYNKFVIDKCYNILINIYGSIFNIIELDKKYRIVIDDNIKTSYIIDNYRELFYSSQYKYINSKLLNAKREIRKHLYMGFCESKGLNYVTQTCHCDVNSKLTSQCIYFLCKSLGYNVLLNHNGEQNDIYSISVSNNTHHIDQNTIKKIISLNTKKDFYVYDLETENHHFQAGIGSMIVHNTDGSHIKGLIINMFHSLWPSLIKNFDDFIQTLLTPIVVATKGKQKLQFYNLSDYDIWKSNDISKGFKTKYYKGLGTSTGVEAKEYFTNINTKVVSFWYENETNDADIELAFSKTKTDNRKEWLKNYDKDNIIKTTEKKVTYSDFIHKELIHFSNEDLSRSIPSIIDGLKISQRKILYGSFLRGLDKDEIKVAQLAGFVSDKACYHHGEMSLNLAIVGMAQNFVGSNNINILAPNGQFGTRLLGGKDFASSRYIWTKFEDITSIIFNSNDNPVLTHQTDDGIPIEPEFYVPIIPMILVNGSEGIGTGFSTKLPPFNPIDIINNIKNILNDKELFDIYPYWNKFTGTVIKVDNNNYEINGTYKIENNKVIITELPVGTWTTNYKEFLEKLLDDKKKSSGILSYIDNNTDEKIYFEIFFSDGFLAENVDNIAKLLHLTKKYSTNNMHLFNKDNVITKYDNVKDIIKEYYEVRLNTYDKRKQHQLSVLKHYLDLLSYKAKFILMVVNEELIINKQKRDDIEKKLEEHAFPKLGKSFDDDATSYDYLLSMPIYNLTEEKIADLLNQKNNKEIEYDNLFKKDIKNIWLDELHELEKKYIIFIKRK